MNHRARCLAAVALSALVALLLVSCAGYHIGSLLKANYHSVAVPMFRNKTLHPQVEAPVTNATIRRFQSDGTLRVESVADADIILTGEIKRYRRLTERYLQNETTVPREYKITMTVQIEARDRRTGQIIVKSTEVIGKADAFIGNNVQIADYQALPLLADDLAKQIVSLLVESW